MVTEHSADTKEVRRIEVFTGAGRRWVWSAEEKAQIVAEAVTSGESVCAIARRHGLTPQQLFGWRRDLRRQAEQASVDSSTFARVIVESGAPISSVGRKSRPIEVVIGAATVRVRLPTLIPRTC
jgi:transposase